MFTFTNAVVGGTFDHLHNGHKQLLDKAFEHSKSVTIGLTTKQLQQDKSYPLLIQTYEDRKKTLEQYLEEKKYKQRAQIIPITDIYGTTLTDKNLQAIFITEENISNVEKINTGRKKRGFPILEAIVVQYLKGEQGEVIRAEKIRAGNLSRTGENYKRLLLSKPQFILPENLRKTVREPLDKLFHETEDTAALRTESTLTIAVGDVISMSLFNLDQQADISIIDYKTRRHDVYKESEALEKNGDVLDVKNQPGTIEKNAVETMQTAFAAFLKKHKKQTIIVSGEEDLLVIPAVLLAPLGSIVLYGQFDQGIVGVQVTEKKKEEVAALLRKFD